MTRLCIALAILSVLTIWGKGATAFAESASAKAWRPPFGLDAVGDPTHSPGSFQADAEVLTNEVINPIDLGAILPPHDWLLLKSGIEAQLHIALYSPVAMPSTSAEVWYESDPTTHVDTLVSVPDHRRTEINLLLPKANFGRDRDVITVVVRDSGNKVYWSKEIPVMLFAQPPHLPRFGATETLLRYDPHISVRDPKSGTFSGLDYASGFDPALRDVVVSLPNGSRYVFWRGSSYIPFWAGRHGTGMCYEWAEMAPPPKDAVDCVEPLMDKELRYSRVTIVESTPARVHVQWTYQSCDLNYKTWGDSAIEDYYFYPDGFGTRVLTLVSSPGAGYELSEFIVIAPALAFPLEFMAKNPIQSIALDGTSAYVPIPFIEKDLPRGPEPPLLYRVRMHKDDPESAVYFNPRDKSRTEELTVFRPFMDQGLLVTPAYWGSHWPLARGNATGGAIDARIFVSPSHNSLMSWARNQPAPLSEHVAEGTDTLGQVRPLRTQVWSWMIGMSDEADAQLLKRARSFATPADIEVQGAEIRGDAYVPERRAYRLNVTGTNIDIRIKPHGLCVNPVFELAGTPKELKKITLGGYALAPGTYAWDGAVLWIGAEIETQSDLALEFGP